MVDHNLLLVTISGYGIRGMDLKWVASSFQNRGQYDDI